MSESFDGLGGGGRGRMRSVYEGVNSTRIHTLNLDHTSIANQSFLLVTFYSIGECLVIKSEIILRVFLGNII